MSNVIKKLSVVVVLLLSLLFVAACEKLPSIVLTPGDKEEYVITFDYDNGSEDKKVKVKSDESLIEPEAPTKDGFEFMGWYKQGNKYDFSLPVKADMTLKAKWEDPKNLLSITYVLFDKTERVEKCEKNTRPDEYIASKDGYSFVGWYQEIDGVVSEEKFKFRDFKIETDIKLVSKWERNSYKVTFNSDGGSDVSFKLVVGDNNVTKPNDPVKEGYKFLGWFEKVNDVLSDTEFNFEGTLIISDTLLVARWEVRTDYKETFEAEMTEYFKEINFGSFVLPKAKDGIANITWTSSNEAVISNAGKIVRPYKQTDVTLTANYTLGEKTTSEFVVNVPGYKLETAETVSSTYVYRNYSKLNDEFFDTMDIIFCAFGKIDETGNVTGTNFFKNVKEYIIPRAKEKGVYVILSTAPESSWVTIADPANGLVDKVVNNLASKVTEYGFDGIDIDWERPKSGQETWFTNLASKLDVKLNSMNPNYLLTAAVGAGKWQPPSYDLPHSKQYLDYVNMMAYGMEKTSKHYQNALYRVSGKSTLSCSIDESVTIFNDLGITNDKILVGLAFYGIKQTYEDGAWGSGKSVFYDNLVTNYFNNPDYVEYFDNDAKVPYLMNKAGTEFISYDNEQSIEIKCGYVKTKGLAGVMAWEAGCDTTGTLVAAMKKALDK